MIELPLWAAALLATFAAGVGHFFARRNAERAPAGPKPGVPGFPVRLQHVSPMTLLTDHSTSPAMEAALKDRGGERENVLRILSADLLRGMLAAGVIHVAEHAGRVELKVIAYALDSAGQPTNARPARPKVVMPEMWQVERPDGTREQHVGEIHPFGNFPGHDLLPPPGHPDAGFPTRF